MMVMSADDENTITDGDDLVSLHKISVFFPSGQYFDKPSIAVKGIVRDKTISTEARRIIKRSFVFSLSLRGRTRKFSRKDSFCFLLLLLPIRWSARMREVFAESDKSIKIT